MAKPTGFMEYARILPPDRDPLSRIGDWKEFHSRFDTEAACRMQAARCMDCGTPYCHSGILYEGAASGCPLNNLIPEFNEMLYRGLWNIASDRLRLTNNFPEFTGRVCPAPCEGACTVGLNDTPVTIKQNEVEIIEREWESGALLAKPPLTRTGRKIAVIGSGPSGLACADLLNKAGHRVTVFEKSDRPGGLLMYGIPNMKLDKDIILRRIRLMEEEGVVFALDAAVGSAVDPTEILAGFDAVVLACGAGMPRDLRVPGRELRGVHFALDYLSVSTKCLLESGRGVQEVRPSIDASGRDAVIVGGGDTGTDCVGTAIRQGCRSVIQLEILPRLPDSRTSDNPWPRWPRVSKVDYGQEEAIARSGKDPRNYCVTVKRFLPSESDSAAIGSLEVVDVEWKKDANGRNAPFEISGSERRVKADLVLLAMGFAGADEKVLEAFGVEKDNRGNAAATFGSFMTNVPKVFAAGDMRRGQSLVVWAIREGRDAARAIDLHLMGKTCL
jgi:glutamate synthase (NADPH/NADH) small chain